MGHAALEMVQELVRREKDSDAVFGNVLCLDHSVCVHVHMHMST